MSATIFVLTVLVFTSAMAAVTMLLAWRMFDRPRHALTWAAAFACAALQWTINAIGLAVFPRVPAFTIVAGALVFFTTTLLVVGTRQRAGLPDRFGAFGAGILLATAVLAWVSWVSPHFGLRLFVSNAYPALLLPVAALAMWPRRRPPNPAEASLAIVLWAFAALEMALALTALGHGPDGTTEARARYELLFAAGLPPAGIATVIAAGFVLAGDLAERVRSLVTRDPLTGALNRRGLEASAAAAFAAARRHKRPLTAVIADLDRFKAINDARGHAAGDAALRRFADEIHALVREDDLFARLGGDEFCLLLSGADATTALAVVERIRAQVGTQVTASFGLATLRGDDTLSDLIARADAALYTAKADGRDRAALEAA